MEFATTIGYQIVDNIQGDPQAGSAENFDELGFLR